MARVKGAMMTRKRRNKVLKLAKGYWGSKSKHFKMANQAVMKSGVYAYTGRKLKKRDFRQLWITRINAACKFWINFIWRCAKRPASSFDKVAAPSSNTLNVGDVSATSLPSELVTPDLNRS